LAQPGQAGLLSAADLLTVRYLRIFSRRFLPMPWMESRSSTRLKAPYDLRIWRISPQSRDRFRGLAEVLRPVLMLIGFSGGFFVALEIPSKTKQSATRVKNKRAVSLQWFITAGY
jgi:hypothetical protein